MFKMVSRLKYECLLSRHSEHDNFIGLIASSSNSNKTTKHITIITNKQISNKQNEAYRL